MAHQSKFISVNLNKSYGQSSSSAAGGHGRPRSGGGGMVVLSRPRSSVSAGQKTTPRLTVPPPLNLPSLRKEHERFEPSSSGPSATHGSSGLRSASGPSTMGWRKPSLPPAFQDNDASAGGQAQSGRSVMTEDQRAGSPYMPPGARPAGQPVPASPAQGFLEKAVVLRGEDFPSLRATAISVPKQKEASNQKQRQKQVGEEHSEGQEERFESQVPLEMRPQMRSSRASTSTVSDGDGGSNRPSGASEKSRKQDGYLPGPLPLVRLRHTSDWADDERDTGLSIPERDSDRRNSRFESIQVHDLYDGRGLRDTETGGASSREFFRGDSFGRDIMASNKEGRDVGSWRLGTRELGVDRDRADVRPFGVTREMGRETNSSLPPFRDSIRDGGTQDSLYNRKDLGSGVSTQNGRSAAEAFSGKGAEQNAGARQGDFPSKWNRGNSFQNNLIPKSPFSSGSKGLSLNDPILNFGREKRLSPNSVKPYIDDANFDSRDPFSGGIGDVKVFKRKKDAPSQDDLHDHVRESYEAELERILRMQEQERQRVMEEQARALELARKEEEERERLAREEEEKRRLLEEEAREARWRAEQEKLEAARRAEEQRIVREEEKRRIIMEEERRKEAAKQKLLELEARIAKRQAEANAKDDQLPSVAVDERVPGPVKERDAPRGADVGDWEEGERMVERITSSASSDSSNMNRYFDQGSRPYSSRNGNASFADRGKHAYHFNSGNTSSLPFHDQESIYRSTRRDSFGSRRGFLKRELPGGVGILSARPSSKGGNVEHLQMQDDFHHERGQRWTSRRDGDNFNRNSDVDADFLDNDKFGDVGWGPGNSHGSPHAPYAERVFQNSEVDGLSSFTRFRHSLKQPHVPPPPSMSSMHRSSYRPPVEHPSSSSFMDSETHCHHASRNKQQIRQTGYDRVYQENIGESETTVLDEENVIHSDHNGENNSPRCDSQSSLSVSSPPDSPMHPSHDEMDVSGDSPALPPSADGERTVSSDNEHIQSALEAGNLNATTTSSSVSREEDDEWAVENNQEMQEQDEYDEEDNNYQEIDEVPEGDDENLDLHQEFNHLQSDVQNKDGEMDQVILGFNEGVEVKIPSNDEFEMTPRNSEKVATQMDSPGSMEEMLSNGVDGLKIDSALLEGTASNSSKIINEAEKAFQALVFDPVASTSYPPESVEASSGSGMPAQNPTTPSLSMPMPSTAMVPPVLPSASTVGTQGEVPVKLQFGLFSGPSLIPSPVPAIQIGSIQMPIHLHTQVGPSLTQMHPSQSTLFQFGQLRYTPPISQSVLPLGPQSMPFVQPPAPASYSLNQNPSGSLLNQVPQDSSQINLGDGITSTDMQPGLPQKILDTSPQTLNSEQLNALSDAPKKGVLASLNQTVKSSNSGKKATGQSASQIDHHGNQDGISKKNYRTVANRESQNHPTSEPQSSRFSLGGKAATVSKAPGIVSGSRGRRSAYSVKNAGSKLLFSGAETLHTDSGGFQRRSRRNNRRTEFRVRENFERKQTQGTESLYHDRQDERSHLNGRVSGISVRHADKKDAMSNRSTKMMNEPDNLNSGASSSQVVSSESKTDKTAGEEASSKSVASGDKSHGGKGTLKTNGSPEEDVDAPLQSGVVRVFKQSGIEAPSDEDDFIEVRSKRQMLNDRREQREKEIKSRSKVLKAPRKQRATSQSSAATSSSNKAAASLGGDAAKSVGSDSAVTERRGFASVKQSLVFTANTTSQTLPPIGTPSVNVDSETKSNNLKSSQTDLAPVISSGGAKLVSGLLFDSKNVAPDNASLPLGCWDSTNLNQQVMALTQTQLDEAMKPAKFDSHVASGMVLEPHKPIVSILTQEKPLSSSSSPINSLLAGEKIQFGAVTSPSILPPVSRTISNGLGAPGSCRLDVKVDSNLPAASNDCSMFFDKEKHPGEPCPNIEDPEAEAEAAASAVAVAAITNDEMVGSEMHPATASGTKGFSSADVTGLSTGGVTTSREVSGQSAGEESLTVALPADLSVDTPSLSLWPPLPSPQSSGPMLSHFPGAPPSHFPCFEMNPMLGGRIFAFGPHDESGGTQGQSQRSTALGSGPIGAWPQCPSGVDSFYGPPAGFTGPFISPGGIPGVQGPPQMVVYNHFAPVGQFGQVGLSFMGATYIPTGKQPDWKHNPASSSVGDTEGNLSNLNVVSGQCTSHSMPTPIQHLGPGSPLMPMASPLTMFDITPFQSSADIPMQARWSHVPPPPLHSVPLSMPLQQHHVEGGMPLQYNHSLPLEASTGNNKFHEPHSSVPDDGSRNIPVQNSTTSEFSGELGLVEQPTSNLSNAQMIRPSYGPAGGNNDKVSNTAKTLARTTTTSGSESSCAGETSNNTSNRTSGPSSKAQQPTSLGQQYIHPAGHADQRSGASQKMGSGGEWHRRTGYQGRNQGSGADKNFGSAKMKQIYVAKTSSGPATRG